GSFSCSSVNYSLSDLLTPAVAWLLDQQNADGGFGEQRTDGSKGSSNVLVSALVLKALTAQATVSQPQADNTRNWLLAKQSTTTGSWDGDPL
ncbi:prenyltransferase/squalene oxidase repeat-containing protein, partial [Acinetobacter baumannii]